MVILTLKGPRSASKIAINRNALSKQANAISSKLNEFRISEKQKKMIEILIYHFSYYCWLPLHLF